MVITNIFYTAKLCLIQNQTYLDIQYVQKKKNYFFQMAVTPFKILESTKAGDPWKELEQTFPKHIMTFLTLNW